MHKISPRLVCFAGGRPRSDSLLDESLSLLDTFKCEYHIFLYTSSHFFFKNYKSTRPLSKSCLPRNNLWNREYSNFVRIGQECIKCNEILAADASFKKPQFQPLQNKLSRKAKLKYLTDLLFVWNLLQRLENLLAVLAWISTDRNVLFSSRTRRDKIALETQILAWLRTPTNAHSFFDSNIWGLIKICFSPTLNGILLC